MLPENLYILSEDSTNFAKITRLRILVLKENQTTSMKNIVHRYFDSKDYFGSKIRFS